MSVNFGTASNSFDWLESRNFSATSIFTTLYCRCWCLMKITDNLWITLHNVFVWYITRVSCSLIYCTCCNFWGRYISWMTSWKDFRILILLINIFCRWFVQGHLFDRLCLLFLCAHEYPGIVGMDTPLFELITLISTFYQIMKDLFYESSFIGKCLKTTL